MTHKSTPVAFFDFDGTLTKSDTLMPFLRFTVGRPAYYYKLAQVSPILIAYFSKLLRNDAAKQIVLNKYLASYDINELFEVGERFCEEVIPSMLRIEGMERLRWHQAQSHDCILVSASMDFYLNAWAQRNGFLACLCTSASPRKGGGWVLKSGNCYGEEKVKRILSYYSNSMPNITFAYGDSDSDSHMLNLVGSGFIWRKNSFFKI